MCLNDLSIYHTVHDFIEPGNFFEDIVGKGKDSDYPKFMFFTQFLYL